MAGVEFLSPPAINYSTNTAPSSPRRFGPCFFSAPASPSRMNEFYGKFDDDFSAAMERSMSRGFGPVSSIPFDWEETPGTPKAPIKDSGDGFGFDFGFEFDFAFNVSEESEKSSRSAEELFDGGKIKIKPLKPPPRLHVAGFEDRSVPRVLVSPRSPIARGKRFLKEALSPRGQKQSEGFKKTEQETERNQETSSGSKWRRRITRSLSPFRVWEFEEENQKQSSKGLSKKWGFKNFLPFRSFSEKNPLKRTALFSRNKKL